MLILGIPKSLLRIKIGDKIGKIIVGQAADARSGTLGSYRRMLRALSSALQLGNAACILELHGRSELPSLLTTNSATRISLPSLKAFGIGPAPDAS